MKYDAHKKSIKDMVDKAMFEEVAAFLEDNPSYELILYALGQARRKGANDNYDYHYRRWRRT